MSVGRILLAVLRMGRFFALVIFLMLALRAGAQQDQKTWHILIEPSFMHPPVSFSIAGAERTLLVPGYMADGEPHYFPKKDWDALGLTWDAFRARAALNTTEKNFRADLVRDSHQVVEYAAIQSGDPLTATMILSPDFLKKLKPIFGPTIIVAVPNRYTVLVFPGLDTSYKDYSPLILRAYHDSPYPVSEEVFTISAAGIRAIGTFEDQ